MDAVKSIYREDLTPVVVAHLVGKQPYISPPHLHDYIEFYYNIKGCRRYLVNNRYYRCEKNDLFIVPRLQIHKALLNSENEYERCIISLSSEMIEKLKALPNMQSNPFRAIFSDDVISHKTHLSGDEHNLFIDLISFYNAENDETEKFVILLKILKFICNKFEKDTVFDQNFAPETEADQILDFIERNFKTQVSVSQIAKDMAVSDAQLYRLFTKETGMTIKEYLTTRRIAEAKKMLQLGYSVKQACFGSGFNDYSNFIKSFKKLEGYTPGQIEELNPPL